MWYPLPHNFLEHQGESNSKFNNVIPYDVSHLIEDPINYTTILIKYLNSRYMHSPHMNFMKEHVLISRHTH
jgi:hypothetical protein